MESCKYAFAFVHHRCGVCLARTQWLLVPFCSSSVLIPADGDLHILHLHHQWPREESKQHIEALLSDNPSRCDCEPPVNCMRGLERRHWECVCQAQTGQSQREMAMWLCLLPVWICGACSMSVHRNSNTRLIVALKWWEQRCKQSADQVAVSDLRKSRTSIQ